ncbi:RHS repeat-associated core domain-containing protein [Pseudomonas sp. Sample_10]|uniref:RHS repeat-associated core domain-containing protein n=1 Tax=Pseudomonas sp. Sample_10 TaxID=2448269 RepID=UPI001035EBBD|nr:RHS repeat-associated core domain-containing protein [Pseudomonas sp. Sample_10]
MPTTTRETVLSRYRYDPLDRLSAQTDIQRFYCNNRLATEVGGGVQTSLFQHDDQLLAQRQARADKIDTTLLATDQQRSVLNALDATRPHAIAYSPYGYRPPENGLLSLLGFNGERPDPVTGHYHLGNGYRQFNPVLMRFNSPDSWSPFGKGGLNAYAYCGADPVNQRDPSGHKFMSRIFGTMEKIKKAPLHKHTKDFLIEQKKILGGTEKIKETAATENMPSEQLLLTRAIKNKLSALDSDILLYQDTHPEWVGSSDVERLKIENLQRKLNDTREFFIDLTTGSGDLLTPNQKKPFSNADKRIVDTLRRVPPARDNLPTYESLFPNGPPSNSKSVRRDS